MTDETEPQKPKDPKFPDNGNGCEPLTPDPIIETLIGDDPNAIPDVIILTGFLGRSPRLPNDELTSYWRLYFTLELTNYVEFSGRDVRCTKSLRTDDNPLAGTKVWLARDAQLQHVNIEQMRADEFVEGRYYAPLSTYIVPQGYTCGGTCPDGKSCDCRQ